MTQPRKHAREQAEEIISNIAGDNLGCYDALHEHPPSKADLAGMFDAMLQARKP